MSRKPEVADAIVYGIADGVSSGLEKSLEKELSKGNPDGVSVFFHILGIAGSEFAKAGVNSDLDPPFRSARELDNGKKRSPR